MHSFVCKQNISVNLFCMLASSANSREILDQLCDLRHIRTSDGYQSFSVRIIALSVQVHHSRSSRSSTLPSDDHLPFRRTQSAEETLQQVAVEEADWRGDAVIRAHRSPAVKSNLIRSSACVSEWMIDVK